MWLVDYVTKNSFSKKDASCGNITLADTDSVAVCSSQEYRKLGVAAPYGIAYVPPIGEKSVVLPLDSGEICLGVISPAKGLNPGEIMLYSSGGASIVLKNDGRVLINGQAFGG